MKVINRRVSYVVANGSLRLKLRWSGYEFVMGLGIKIDKVSDTGKAKWDGRRCVNGSVHGRDRVNASTINRRLMDLENKIDLMFYQYEVQDLVPDKEDVKREMMGHGHRQPVTAKSSLSVEVAFNRFMTAQSEEKGWAFNTVKSVQNIANLVRQFSPKAKMSHIDRDWLARFVNYQKHHRLGLKRKGSGQTESCGYANNVIAKNCRIFKWFLKWAVDERLIDRELVDEFRPSLKTISKPVIFLTWEELIRVWEMDLSKMADVRLDEARDIFCFQCFTSLRYSDAHTLRTSQVKEDSIVLATRKTATLLEIELNKYSKAILNKYASRFGEFALPRMDVSSLNRLLKIIGKMAGIDEPVIISQFYGSDRKEVTRPKYEVLSSHAGRRTFICSALALGISPSVVMKWTGHSEYSAMKPYIDIADSIKRDSMKLFDKL